MLGALPELGPLDDDELRELVRALEDEALQVSYAPPHAPRQDRHLDAELVNRLHKEHAADEDVIRSDAGEPPAPDGGVRQPPPCLREIGVTRDGSGR